MRECSANLHCLIQYRRRLLDLVGQRRSGCVGLLDDGREQQRQAEQNLAEIVVQFGSKATALGVGRSRDLRLEVFALADILQRAADLGRSAIAATRDAEQPNPSFTGRLIPQRQIDVDRVAGLRGLFEGHDQDARDFRVECRFEGCTIGRGRGR